MKNNMNNTMNFYVTKRRRNNGIDGTVAQTILYIILTILVALVVMPLIVTFSLSLKLPMEHMQGIWSLPSSPQWVYYAEAFNTILKPLLYSLMVCVFTTAGVVLFSSITAYVFARHQFPLKEVLFSLILALMMIPGVLTLTPQLLTVRALNLLNTHWGLILPGIAGGQVGAIFLFRTFFNQQPKDIYESATIDGANDLRMYATLTLPLAVPVLIIQAIGTFSLMYNDFLWPTLVIQKESIKTLMPVLKSLAEKANVTKPGLSYAMYIVASIPLMIVSALGLKFFINGDYASGLKL